MNVLSKLSCNTKTKEKYKNIESGIVFIYDNNINKDIKRAFANFEKWLSKNLYFPVKLYIYIRNTKHVQTTKGESVVGRLFAPGDAGHERAFAEIAVGDYKELLNKEKKTVLLAEMMDPIAHEIVHYFQWINNEICGYLPYFKEIYAKKYSSKLLLEYSKLEKYPFDDLEYCKKERLSFNIFSRNRN